MMTQNKLLVVVMMLIYAICTDVMGKLDGGFNDGNYILAFIAATLSVVVVLSKVKD